MPALSAHPRGQALPLALACLFISTLFFAFCLRSGQRLVQRERVRARADVTAFSGAVGYAKALNLLSLSQQAAATAWGATLVTYGSAYGYVRKVQKLQKELLQAGPYVVEGSLLYTGLENGLLPIPVWNKPVLFQQGESLSFQAQDLKPDFHVRPLGALKAAAQGLSAGLGQAGIKADAGDLEQGMHEGIQSLSPDQKEEIGKMAKKALPDWNLDWLLKTDHYEYQRRSDGVLVQVPAGEGGPVEESNGHGGRATRNKQGQAQGNRYLHAVRSVDEELQVSLEDQGDHILTLAAVQAPGERDSQRPGWVLALSQVQVAGGDLSMGDLDGAGWGATFVPVRLFGRLTGQGREGDAGRLASEVVDALLQNSPLPAAWRETLRRSTTAAKDLLAVRH